MKRILASLLVLPLLLATSCGKKERIVDQAYKERNFHYGIGAEARTVDPAQNTDSTGTKIIVQLFEGLVEYHHKTNEVIPGVAKSWDISKDGKTYTFHLRDNAKWSNGDAVTANDFVYSWERVLNPLMASEYAPLIYVIKNAQKYNQGKIKDFAQVGVKAKDDHTLVVDLEYPAAYFLNILQYSLTRPVHKATIEKFGDKYDRDNTWTRAENIVSNGPFMMTEWTINKYIKIKKNPNYWDAKNIWLNGAILYPVDNVQNEERMFRSGALHVTNDTIVNKIPVYQKEHPELIVIEPYLSVYYYSLNNKRKPLNDKRVRKALALAINRHDLVKYVTKAGQQPAYNMVPPGTGGYTSKQTFKEDVAEAKRLLAEAGFPNGEGFPTDLNLMYNTSENHKSTAEAIQQMWKKNLNIQIQLANQDWKVFIDTRNKHNFDIARDGWIGDFNDPLTFVDLQASYNPQNHSAFNSKTYDDLVTKARYSTDQNERFAAFDQLEAILKDEMPVIPLYFYTTKFLRQTDVRGYDAHLQDIHPLRWVSLERPEKAAK